MSVTIRTAKRLPPTTNRYCEHRPVGDPKTSDRSCWCQAAYTVTTHGFFKGLARSNEPFKRSRDLCERHFKAFAEKHPDIEIKETP